MSIKIEILQYRLSETRDLLRKALADKDAVVADKDAVVADCHLILVSRNRAVASRNRAVADRNASERMSIELQMKIEELTAERDKAEEAKTAAEKAKTAAEEAKTAAEEAKTAAEEAKTAAELDMNLYYYAHIDCAKAHDKLLMDNEELRKSNEKCVQKIYKLEEKRDHILQECVRLTESLKQAKCCIKFAKVESGR